MESPSGRGAGNARRVLVIFPGALGDLVCLVPALRALARRYRGASVELMARAELAHLAVGRLGVARGHSIDRREIAALFADPAELAGAADFVRSFGLIHSFFAADDARFGRALGAAAAPAPVYFHRFRAERAGHVAAAYLEEIGERGAPLDTRMDLRPEDLAAARAALARVGLDDARVVLLFPGSGGRHKNWPPRSFAALADALAPWLRPLFVLGPAERALEPALASALGAGAVRWLRDLPLATVAGLARVAAGFVGNDSGVSHLAAAAGARGVAIFGPTDPERWRPLGRVRIVRSRDLSELGPLEVESALREALAAKRRQSV